MTPSSLAATLIALTRDAAREIMAVYSSDFAVRAKSDLSPVTEADEAGERVILAGLAKHFPNMPVIAEEQVASGRKPQAAASFFLVDPLDGTKEFLSRNGEFTINIALISNGIPVAGVVYAPATHQLFWGEAGLGAAFQSVDPGTDLQSCNWSSIKVRKPPTDGLIVLASRSHRDAETDAYLTKLKVKSLISAGSSLKFCLVAKGDADVYPRFGRTMEWDTAAGQAVLEAAGGKVVDVSGVPLRYGKAERGFDNPAFVASA